MTKTMTRLILTTLLLATLVAVTPNVSACDTSTTAGILYQTQCSSSSGGDCEAGEAGSSSERERTTVDLGEVRVSVLTVDDCTSFGNGYGYQNDVVEVCVYAAGVRHCAAYWERDTQGEAWEPYHACAPSHWGTNPVTGPMPQEYVPIPDSLCQARHDLPV